MGDGGCNLLVWYWAASASLGIVKRRDVYSSSKCLFWSGASVRWRDSQQRGLGHFKFIRFLLRKSSISNNKANGNALSMLVIEQMWSVLRGQMNRNSSRYNMWLIHVQGWSGCRRIVLASFVVKTEKPGQNWLRNFHVNKHPKKWHVGKKVTTNPICHKQCKLYSKLYIRWKLVVLGFGMSFSSSDHHYLLLKLF